MANAPRGRTRAMASHKSLFHSIATKLQAMELAERPPKEEAARQFKMDPKRTPEWCQQKDSLVKMNKRKGFVLAKKTRQSWTKSHGSPDSFVNVMAFYYTSFLLRHVCSDFIRWGSRTKWTRNNN